MYGQTGMAGLAILFAAIAIGALYVATRALPRAWRHIMMVLLGMLMLQEMSVRPSTITLLFFALITNLVLREQVWKKWRWFLPVFFLLWANLHGGFLFGLATIGLSVFLTIIKSKKILWTDIGIVATSAIATLCNPYGIGLWHEVFVSVLDSRLRYTVNEWMPTFISLDPSIWLFVAVVIAYMIAARKTLDRKVKIMSAIFLALGISSYRNVTLFAIFATGASTLAYEALRQTTLKSAAFRQRFATFHKNFFMLVLIGAALHIATLHTTNVKTNTEKSEYPVQAISYLKTHPTSGNLLSLYEWGGYLLWKYPEKKVFVDGRMPSWRLDARKFPNESPDATWDYLEMFRFKKPFKPFIAKYNIRSILIKSRMITATSKTSAKKKREIRLLLEQMSKNNMVLVYRDEVATLFVKKPL